MLCELAGLENLAVITKLKANRIHSGTRAREPKLRSKDIVVAAVLLAWVCAVFWIHHYHGSFIGPDQIAHYFPAAQKVLDGQGYRAFEADVYRGPGYPLALSAASCLLPGGIFEAGKVIALTSSTLLLLFTYLLLRRVFGSITALAALLLTIGVNTFTYVSCANCTDTPFACLAMAALYFAVRHEKPRGVDIAVAGVLSGLALTIRWNGLFLPILIAARIVILPRHELGLRSKLQFVAIGVLAFLVAGGPWLYVNYLLHGSPLHTCGAIALDPAILSPSRSLAEPLVQALTQEPLDFGRRFLAKLFGSFPMVIQGLSTYPGPGGWVMAGWFWVAIAIGLLLLLVRFDPLQQWFLLISGVWWASLVPIHYESRFFMLLIPTFAALAVRVITTGALPDVRLTLVKGKRASAAPGYLLERLVGSRLPRWLTSNLQGVSLAALALISYLAVTAFSTVRRIQARYQWVTGRTDFYHELAQFVRHLPWAGQPLPIGARQWSPARYWIPVEAGTPVAPLPIQDYQSLLPKLSYVLYDQIGEKDVLYDWWDDPSLSELADPLRAPVNLEAVYYKPDTRRAILYRILEQSKPAEIVSGTASSTLPGAPAAHAFDSDAQTWWASEPRSTENEPESITLDLGRSVPINRLWLLPRPDEQAFPADLRIEVSDDGTMWQPVIEAKGLSEPIRQSPQVFPFAETVARWVKVTATRLRRSEDGERYLASLAEARISLAVERSAALPLLSLAAADLFFDPLSNELSARIHNNSAVPGKATVEFYKGWTLADAEYLGEVQSSLAVPGSTGIACVSADACDPLEPGHCLPIWARLKPPTYQSTDLDTYGIAFPQPQTVFDSVCSPQKAVIDFGLAESSSSPGWEVLPNQAATGGVSTHHDRELDMRAMRVRTEADDGFVIRRRMRVYSRPRLTLWVKSAKNFIIYTAVRDVAGESYYVQYMPFTWPDYPAEFPSGKYIYYPLGRHLVDGSWHRIERDVFEDFSAKTGKRVDYIEALSIRAYRDLGLADLRLEALG
jgi:hypothetical protein